MSKGSLGKKSPNNYSASISCDKKASPEYKSHIANLALADAEHDLGEVLSSAFGDKNSQLLHKFNQGIPYSSTRPGHKISEDDALNRVFSNNTNWKNKVPDVTSARTDGSLLEISFNNSQTYFTYNAVKFCIKSHEEYKAPSSDFGKKFVENTSLGGSGNEAAIIVDFSQHHFLEKIKEGTNANFTVHYLMTPEVVNDPAGKPNVHNKSIFGNTSMGGMLQNPGVELRSYVQTDPDPLSYTKFNAFEPSPLNNFFSNYEFTLSPIKQNFTNQKAEKFITTLNITYDNGDAKPLTNTVEDSKGENSITTVIAYLRTLMSRLFNATDIFNFNSKCQQKRGGDWFQALACLDAKNRAYTQILPNADRSKPFTLHENCPVYLVTHDQIAVAFALSNGINVIYMNYHGLIYVFKNMADPAFFGSGKCIEEILFDGIKKNWIEHNSGEFLRRHIVTADNYITARTHILDVEKAVFESKVEAFNSFIKQWDSFTFTAFTDRSVDQFFNALQEKIQQLFSQAVRLMFVEINLIDVTPEIDFIKNNKDTIQWTKGFNQQEGGSKEKFYKKINTFSRNLNNIKGLCDRFGLFVTDYEKDSLPGHITNWININVKKMDMYRLANGFTVEYGDSVVTQPKSFLSKVSEKMSRITSFTTKNTKISDTTKQNETIKYDKYLFLSFIQTLSNRTKLVDSLHSLKNVLNNFYAIFNAQPDSYSRGRDGRLKIPPNIAKYNCVVNFINDATILLNTEKNADHSITNSASDNIIISDSTDNIILSEDNEEIANIKKDGKFSNNTENEDVVAQSGGKSYAYFTTSSGKNDATVVNDLSIKQITWSLLTGILTNGFDYFHMKNIIKQYKTIIPERTGEVRTSTGETAATYNYDEDPYIQELKAKINASLIRQGTEIVAPAVALGTAVYLETVSPLLGATIVGLSWTAEYVYEKYIVKKGGAENEMGGVENEMGGVENEMGVVENEMGGTSATEENIASDLLKDFTFGYHPLMPIYMLLSPFYYTLGAKYESDPFFYTYFTYINVLEKMINVLEANYLNDALHKNNVLAAYLLGFSLGTFLFSSNTSLLQNNKILDVVGISQQDYYTFALKNDSFASLITGAIHLTPDEEALGFVLLDSELFKNFINVEVNIKEILERGTSETDLPSHMVLKNRIADIMTRIVTKVNNDRGTPLAVANDAVASGVKPVMEEVMEEGNVALSGVKPSYEEIKAQRLKKKAEDDERKRAEQMEMLKKINLKTGGPTLKADMPRQVGEISSAVGGGANKRRRIKSNKKKNKRNKMYTRKQKNSVKVIRFTKKTKKHKRNHKRTRKNY